MIVGIKIFSEENQIIRKDHPCHIKNGGCEKLCFPVPDNSTKNGIMAR